MKSHPDLGAIGGPGGPERREAIEHLRACAECRAAALADDPASLFALLALRPISESDLDVVSEAVSRRLDAEPRTLLDALREGFFPRVAAAVAAVLVVGFATVTFRSKPRIDHEVSASVARPAAGAQVTLTGGEARVVDLAVGDIQVVMIFDPEIEL